MFSCLGFFFIGPIHVNNYRIRTLKLCILFLSFLVSWLPGNVSALGNLMVTPTRVVFDDRTRTAQVTVVNQGDEFGSFRISFIRQNMIENGSFTATPETEEGLYSDRLIRYSPRQISLPPGRSQVVRLMLRKPANLLDGEYRSHMLFQALPPPSMPVSSSKQTEKPNNIQIEILPILGVSIPVIVRHGKLTGEVSLSDAKIAQIEGSDRRVIAVDITRRGNSSVYGDIRATFTPRKGNPIVIAKAKGVAVYTNLEQRHFILPLSSPESVKLADGVVDLIFLKSGLDAETGTLARTNFVVK